MARYRNALAALLLLMASSSEAIFDDEAFDAVVFDGNSWEFEEGIPPDPVPLSMLGFVGIPLLVVEEDLDLEPGTGGKGWHMGIGIHIGIDP